MCVYVSAVNTVVFVFQQQPGHLGGIYKLAHLIYYCVVHILL